MKTESRDTVKGGLFEYNFKITLDLIVSDKFDKKLRRFSTYE